MSDKAEKAPWGPSAYLTNGFAIGFIGGILFAVGIDGSIDALTFAGYVVGVIGTVMFLIGVIAKGVQVGNDASGL